MHTTHGIFRSCRREKLARIPWFLGQWNLIQTNIPFKVDQHQRTLSIFGMGWSASLTRDQFTSEHVRILIHWKWPIKNYFGFLLLGKFKYSLTMAYKHSTMPLKFPIQPFAYITGTVLFFLHFAVVTCANMAPIFLHLVHITVSFNFMYLHHC